jgi:hypothetical protein
VQESSQRRSRLSDDSGFSKLTELLEAVGVLFELPNSASANA